MRLPNIHPGEILLWEFIVPAFCQQSGLGQHGLSMERVEKICRGDADLNSADVVALSCVTQTSVRFWKNLQAMYDEEKEGGQDATK